MKNKINKALPAQAAELSDLAFRSKAFWGYSAQFMRQCRAELTYSSDYIENAICYVLEDENQLVGFYLLGSLDQSNCELEGLFVEPQAIRKGYGRKLVDHAKSLAVKKGFKKIIIQSDPNSLDFYIAVGAVQFGLKPSLSIPGRDLPMLELSLSTS